MKLSIIIVNWNTRAMLLDCLRAVAASALPFTHELIVVDNASNDGSAEAVAAAFPAVKLIKSATNLGFAKANNLALEAAMGELVLLLNPDTLVDPMAIMRAVARYESDPTIGVLGGKQFEADGRVQASCGHEPSLETLLFQALFNTLLSVGAVRTAQRLATLLRFEWVPLRRMAALWDADAEHDVGWIMGSFLLIRGSLAKRLGLFDERFTMYGEDMDLGLRVRRAGYRALYCPAVTLVHFGGASTKRMAAEADAAHFLASIRFYEKHWGKAHALIYRGLLVLGAAATAVRRCLGNDRAYHLRLARLRMRVALLPDQWRWP